MVRHPRAAAGARAQHPQHTAATVAPPNHRSPPLRCLYGHLCRNGGPWRAGVSTAEDAPRRCRFDRNRDGDDDGLAGRENSAIDHVLLSPGLWGRVAGVRFIRDAPPGVSGEALSDHWPIVVELAATDEDGVCDAACLERRRARDASGGRGACLASAVAGAGLAATACAMPQY